jgi:hypothetical protein
LYGEEAVIPEEVKLGSLRADQEPQNKEDTNLASRYKRRRQTSSTKQHRKISR